MTWIAPRKPARHAGCGLSDAPDLGWAGQPTPRPRQSTPPAADQGNSSSVGSRHVSASPRPDGLAAGSVIVWRDARRRLRHRLCLPPASRSLPGLPDAVTFHLALQRDSREPALHKHLSRGNCEASLSSDSDSRGGTGGVAAAGAMPYAYGTCPGAERRTYREFHVSMHSIDRSSHRASSLQRHRRACASRTMDTPAASRRAVRRHAGTCPASGHPCPERAPPA